MRKNTEISSPVAVHPAYLRSEGALRRFLRQTIIRTGFIILIAAIIAFAVSCGEKSGSYG